MNHDVGMLDAPKSAWTPLQDQKHAAFGDASLGHNWANGYYSEGAELFDDRNCRSEAETCD